MNTPNVISELAEKARKPRGSMPGVPKIRHAVQRSLQHLELAVMNSIADKGFPIIDGEAFKKTYHDEKHGIKLPVFAFFDVTKSPVVKYVFEKHGDHVLKVSEFQFQEGYKYQNGLDGMAEIDVSQLAKFFPPPLPGKEQNRYSRHRLFFETKLQHIIPESVVAKIDEHVEKSTFNNGMFIVADVQNTWSQEQKDVNIDPLLVGVDRFDYGWVFYLVDKFDLTPAESYVTKEFVTQ